MGSLHAGVFGPLLPSSSRRSDWHLQRHRSRLWRIMLFEKVDCFQCVCIVVVFFFSSPSSSSNRSSRVLRRRSRGVPVITAFAQLWLVRRSSRRRCGWISVRFHPSKLLEKFRREANGSAALSRPEAAASCGWYKLSSHYTFGSCDFGFLVVELVVACFDAGSS